MKQKPKTVEEKEGSPEGQPSFPSLVGHMKINPSADSLQAHAQQFFNQLPDPISPQDLPQLLHLALTKMIEAALAQERQFHLQDHPEDRANGYAPQGTSTSGPPPSPWIGPAPARAFTPPSCPNTNATCLRPIRICSKISSWGARSFAAARRTLQALGLSYSAEQTEQLLQ